jgi:hypothetical protein
MCEPRVVVYECGEAGSHVFLAASYEYAPVSLPWLDDDFL